MAYSSLRRLLTGSRSSFSRLPIALLVGSVLLTAGCHPKISDPKDPKFIVAEKKGEWTITRGDLDTQIASYLQQSHMTPEQVGPEKMPLLETKMLENMVLKKMLLAKAATLNLKPEEIAKQEAAQLDQLKGAGTEQEFTAQLKTAGMTLDDLKQRIHEKVLITDVLQQEALKDVEPSEAEISDIYVKNKDHFVVPEKYRASRILVHLDDKTTPAEKTAKKKAIDKAHARVVKGEDFSKVATEVSEDRSSAPKGGDIGWFARGENEPQFDEVAFATKDGVVSAVFETPLGYQFVKITGIQPPGTVPLSDVRPYIAKKLKEVKGQEAEEVYSEKLLADPSVTFYLVRVDMTKPQGPAGPASAPADGSGAPAAPVDASAAPAPAPEPAPAPAPAPEPAPAPAPAPATK